jgi:hypothetical protein
MKNVIEQLQDWCKNFIAIEKKEMICKNITPKEFECISRIIQAFNSELIQRGCRCPICHELGYNREWNKDKRGYDTWCDFCSHIDFEPEI